MFRRVMRGALAIGMTVSMLGTLPSANAAATITNVTITSKAADHITIAATVFQPAGASADTPVPMIMHSHGWAGGRSTSGMTSWTDNGYGVLSFDQRGHGSSGGEANVEDPVLEGKDIEAVIDYIAGLDWVAKDSAYDATFGTADPVLGAIGGSYGGGYQTIGALTETRNYGKTRFNALAPEITWYDLPNSLGPDGVVRTLWVTLLYAAGAAMVPQYIHEGFAIGAATGWFPDGTIPVGPNMKEIFLSHSPRGFADAGIKLDIPVLFGQGITDNLFNLNQGIHNFQEVLTPGARAQSLLVGYNGGHVLPEVYPLSQAASGDTCSGPGGFSALSREFFAKAFAGEDTQGLLPAQYNLTDHNGAACLSTSSVNTYLTVTPMVAGPMGNVAAPAIASPAAALGAPVSLKIADGPITVTGIPRLRGTLTTVGPDARAFFGLSVGTGPGDLDLVQNNTLPIRRLVPAIQEPITFELPGVGISVPAGQSLYLTVTSVASAFVGYGSRTPGAVVIADPRVDLPVQTG